jgi:hypothetical protein
MHRFDSTAMELFGGNFAPRLDFEPRYCQLQAMREKELRLALICYGGVSLAVYMHGITKEIWRLASASRAHHAGDPEQSGSEAVYRQLIRTIAEEGEVDLRIFVDILPVPAPGDQRDLPRRCYLERPLLDPLTDLWLDTADVDTLLNPGVSSVSRFAKAAAVPLAWALSAKKGGAIDRRWSGASRRGSRKLSNFVRARWFAPPFSGPGFTKLLLDALDAMRGGGSGPPCFRPISRSTFSSPSPISRPSGAAAAELASRSEETEHRLTISFRDDGGSSAAGAIRRNSPLPRGRPRAFPAHSRRSASANSMPSLRSGSRMAWAAAPSWNESCRASPLSERPRMQC